MCSCDECMSGSVPLVNASLSRTPQNGTAFSCMHKNNDYVLYLFQFTSMNGIHFDEKKNFQTIDIFVLFFPMCLFCSKTDYIFLLIKKSW